MDQAGTILPASTAPVTKTPATLYLEHVAPLLGKSGCIKDASSLEAIVSLMKQSQFLVGRCMLLNVLMATKTPAILEMFIQAEGWSMLNAWLSEAKRNMDNEFMVEVMKVLKRLPVTISVLKKGNMGKLIKQLSKYEHCAEVNSLASDLLASWMAIFREGQASKVTPKSEDVSTTTTSSSKSSSSSSVAKMLSSESKQRKRKESSSSTNSSKQHSAAALTSPVEAHPPPGPLVPLGRPREKLLKRPRDNLLPSKGQHLPLEKKQKESAEERARNRKLVESSQFMDALQLSSKGVKEKKIVKKHKPASRHPSNGGAETNSSQQMDSTQQQQQNMNVPTTENSNPGSVEEMETESANGGNEDSKKKKKVSWPSDDKLTQIQYFELDESERGNVNNHQSFMDAAQREKLLEREAVERMFGRDRLMEMIPWQPPPRVEGVIALAQRGGESQQKMAQAEREGKVLAQLFLSKASVPPSATEPDPDPDHIDLEPKVIPTLEPSIVDSVVQPPALPPPTAPGPPHPGPMFASTSTHPPQGPGMMHHPPQMTQPVINHHYPEVLSGLSGPAPNPPPGQRPMMYLGGGSGGGERGGGGGGEGGNMFPPMHYQQQQQYPHHPHPHHHPYDPPPPPVQGPGMGMGLSSPGPHSGPVMDQQMPWGGEMDGSNGMAQGLPYPGEPIPPLGFFRNKRRGGGGGGGRGGGGGGGGGGPRIKPENSRICKHFLTHGCKLRDACRFLHCTPEELATKMAYESSGGVAPPPPSQLPVYTNQQQQNNVPAGGGESRDAEQDRKPDISTLS